jgi:phage shock protein PspC (stress-responsive transcriptional regulator)
MYCNHCGNQITENSEFCSHCGKQVAMAAFPSPAARKRLVRPREGRKIAGVCRGFADYFDVDVAIVRIIWIAAAVCGLLGVVAYIAGWIVMAEEPLALPAMTSSDPKRAANL